MQVNSLTLCSLLIALAAGFATLAGAQSPPVDAGTQPLDAVGRAAKAAVRREIDPGLTGVEINVVPVDNRLRLPTCNAPLESVAQPPRNGQSRVLVRVACESNGHWTVNVAVDIQRTSTVLIMKRAVARGERIGAADVNLQTRVLPGLASPFVSSLAELSDRVTRRPIPAGTALSAEALTAALLIHRGQSVTLTSSAAGVEVRAPGQAMADAALNQRVRVQNLLSLKIVEGVADIDSVVRVSP
jgi:flagellar basal body P-ring formation protein FlgA